MPELSREEFTVLAAQAGFQPNDPHLDELYPDVVGMLARLPLIEAVANGETEPAPAPGHGA
ncbi:MAG: hypothetical protein VW450_08615 [Chloroflexota bacterium]